MAYCRMGDDSDVYAFAGMKFYVHVAGITITCDNLTDFRETLLRCRDEGYKVPQRAIDRVEREMNEIDLVSR